MEVLTIHTLSRALKKSSKHGMSEEEAHMIAEHILTFFGFDDECLDNFLSNDDRNVFYMAEDMGILVTRREETTLPDGREWRINYWVLNKEKIQEIIDDKGVAPPPEVTPSDIYGQVPSDIWIRE